MENLSRNKYIAKGRANESKQKKRLCEKRKKKSKHQMVFACIWLGAGFVVGVTAFFHSTFLFFVFSFLSHHFMCVSTSRCLTWLHFAAHWGKRRRFDIKNVCSIRNTRRNQKGIRMVRNGWRRRRKDVFVLASALIQMYGLNPDLGVLWW